MIELSVQGMTCGHCIETVARAVKALDAQADVQVDVANKRVRVKGKSPADRLIRALGYAGYPAALASAPGTTAATRRGCCCG